MSEVKKVLVNHPDGRICELPVDVLDKYVVPADKVKALAAQAGAQAAAAEGGEPHEQAAASYSVVLPATGQTIVLNFYLGPQAKLSVHEGGPGKAGGEVEGYHMDMDAMGSLAMHGDWRVGPYIDKAGRPAFGPHSHDPVSGNAQ